MSCIFKPITTFNKYLFGIVVTAYVVMVIGIPVYFHYCGGELEKINYVMRGDSCCGGEEDDSAAEDNGCCKDESLVLKNNTDFTLKHPDNHHLVKLFSQLFYLNLPFSQVIVRENPFLAFSGRQFPPPKLQNDLIISTSVLRI